MNLKYIIKGLLQGVFAFSLLVGLYALPVNAAEFSAAGLSPSLAEGSALQEGARLKAHTASGQQERDLMHDRGGVRPVASFIRFTDQPGRKA